MRISDWSSDVCSSDLTPTRRRSASGGIAARRAGTPCPFGGAAAVDKWLSAARAWSIPMFRSLTERLSAERDDDPRSAESYGSINDLRAAVSADLEQLLNTRSEGARLIPGVFEECRSSLLTYGISDYSSLSLLSTHDRDGIRRSLERAIALHEKRLTRVRGALQQQRPYERALRFHVDGLLDPGPAHAEARYDAVRQLATQCEAGN